MSGTTVERIVDLTSRATPFAVGEGWLADEAPSSVDRSRHLSAESIPESRSDSPINHPLRRATDRIAGVAAPQLSVQPEVQPAERAAALGRRLDAALARGDLAAAQETGRELTPQLSVSGPVGAQAHRAHGELAAALGDSERAREHFQTAGALHPAAGPDVLPWRSGAALALLRTGDSRAASELAHAEVELATACGSPTALAGALRTLAAVDAGGRRVQTLLRARAILADRAPDRLSTQIATDLGGMLILSPDPAMHPRAIALLREAEEQAARQELWPLHERVRRILEQSGEAPRRGEDEALALLTVSERRVARLAADGLTNKQIAGELVVTVKAIEWHLSRIYRKLDISSRAELPLSRSA